MGGGGRDAKNSLRSPYWPQSFLKTPKCFKMPVLSVEFLHHQNSTPNPYRLGVSISTSRKPRGDCAHSARARGVHDLTRRAVSSTLFCPLFSQNLHQLFRRGTRTVPYLLATYIVFAVVRIVAAFGLLPFLASFALTFRIRTVLLFVGDSSIWLKIASAGFTFLWHDWLHTGLRYGTCVAGQP